MVGWYGYESRLSSCGHSGWDIGNCRHNEDVGVSCGKPRYIVLCCLNSYLLVQVINLSYRHIRYIDTFLLSLASCTDTTTAVYTTAVIVVAVSVPLVMTVIIRLFVVGCCRKRERIDRRTTGRHHGTGRPLSTRVMYSDATRQPEVHIADDIRETWPSEGYYPSRQRTTIRRQPEDAPPSYAVVIRYPELFPSPTSADHTRQLDDLHPCKWTWIRTYVSRYTRQWCSSNAVNFWSVTPQPVDMDSLSLCSDCIAAVSIVITL